MEERTITFKFLLITLYQNDSCVIISSLTDKNNYRIFRDLKEEDAIQIYDELKEKFKAIQTRVLELGFEER